MARRRAILPPTTAACEFAFLIQCGRTGIWLSVARDNNQETVASSNVFRVVRGSGWLRWHVSSTSKEQNIVR
ncbi:hypothetical protein BKA66DRAFT_451082 [Pyrenochaeta sp. MPI-SDFR-AT-0127]|nr:hypothetical protein BKA66DRAFT_451082 [Pyrenochaeta sp. MPI-SDFR-AT-0127]